MADKAKKGISVQTTFGDGESPTAAKLNTIGSQSAFALQQLERAVGDLHDESYPYSSIVNTRLSIQARKVTANSALTGAVERPLDIVSLARLVGPASNLNPHELESGSVTEVIPVGVHEFGLRYPIDGLVTDVVIAGAGGEFSTQRTNLALMDIGSYYITSDGKVHLTVPTTGGTITYDVDPASWGGGLGAQGSTFNVIPDPNQLAAGGPGVAFGSVDAAGRYPITLPAATHQQWSNTQTTTVLQNEDVNKDLVLKLPAVIVENYTAGDIIPGGFLLLKNYTTGAVYDDAIYYYNSASTLLIGGVILDTEIAAGNLFCIITVGSDLTGAVDDLRRKSAHSHDRTWGEPLAELIGISGFLADAGGSGTGPYIPSNKPGNFAPQYLHRDGWTSGIDENVNDENVMRGTLVMGVDGVSPSNRLNGGTSFSIAFGRRPTASSVPKIHSNNIDELVLQAPFRSSVFDVHKGIRVTDGALITEEGLTGGHEEGVAIAISSYAVVTFISWDASAPADVSYITLSPLTDKKIVSHNLLYETSLGSNIWLDASNVGAFHITVVLEETVNPPRLKLEFDGGSWPDSGVVGVKVSVWYYTFGS